MTKLSGNTIKIKYIGKSPQVFVEYNGKRYVFSKKKPVIKIPVEVYDYFKMEDNPFILDIIPVQEEFTKIIQEETVSKSREENFVKRGRGRPKKG